MADSFAAALAKLQADLPPIRRTARGQAGTRQYKYPPYDAILAKVRPVLSKHGFMWHTMPILDSFQEPARFVLWYALVHLPSGEAKEGRYPLTEGAAQAQGSQISYAKRYSLVAVLDLVVVGEDDDGMAERTPARVTGAEHERLRYGTMEATPDDRPAERGPDPNDRWQDQPAGEALVSKSDDSPGSIDEWQKREIGKLFRSLGITDDSVRHGMAGDIVARQILSIKQLSRDEAVHVMKDLAKQLRARREEQP